MGAPACELERALDALNVPYRAESSSLVYRAEEVRAVMAALRAIADPSDRLSCVTALRSTLFAVGDDELWRYRRANGAFDVRVPVPEGLEGSEAGVAMTWLQGLYRRARWLAPSELLTELVVERRVLEVATMRPRARDQWRRLRFVIDQARAWSDAEGGGLRDYLAWAAAQAGETVRVSEAVLPERDLDVVKVMTIHAAKGLEFPLVALSGMTSAPRRDSGVRLLWTSTDFAVRLTSSLQTTDFELAQPVDEQMDSLERRRLLYVGATRARDHLIVSLHRGGRSANTNAVVLAEASAWEGAADLSGLEPASRFASSSDTSSAVESWSAFSARAGEARERSEAAWARSASGYEGTEPEVALPFEPLSEEEQGQAKGPRDLDAPA